MLEPVQYKLGTLNFTPSVNGGTRNISQPLELPVGPLVTALAFEISGAVTLTAANNIPANTLRGDEANLLYNIRLEDQAGKERIRINGNQLRKSMFFRTGRFPDVTPAVGDGATANVPFKSTYYLILSEPDMNKNLDMALLTRLLGKCKLTVEMGAPNDINSTATGWTTTPVVDVYLIGGNGNHVPIMTPDYQYLTGAITVSGEQSIPIPARTNPIQAMMLTLITTDTTIAGSAVGQERPDITKTVAIRNNKTYIKNKSSWSAMWQMQAARRMLPSLFNRSLGTTDTVDATGAGTGAFQRYAQNSLENLYGTLYIEFPLDGSISGVLSKYLDQLTVDLDLNAPCRYELLIIGGSPITSDQLATAGISRPVRRDAVIQGAMARANLFTATEKALLGIS